MDLQPMCVITGRIKEIARIKREGKRKVMLKWLSCKCSCIYCVSNKLIFYLRPTNDVGLESMWSYIFSKC